MRTSYLVPFANAFREHLTGADYNATPNDLLRSYREVGYSKRERAQYLRDYMRKRLLHFTHKARVRQFLDAKLTRVTDDHRYAAEQILLFSATYFGTLTLVTATTDFNAYLAAAQADRTQTLHMRQGKLFRRYMDFAYEGFQSAVLNSANATPWLAKNGYVRLPDGEIAPQHEVETCSCCGELFRGSNMQYVYESTDLDDYHRTCNNCLRSDAFYCEVSGYWFESANFSRYTLNDGRTFCYEYCHEEHEIVSYDEDEDEYYTEGQARLPDYHGAHRPWRAAPTSIPLRAIGVELEIGFAKGEEGRRRFLKNLVTNGGRLKDRPFSVERDGSLSNVPGGMEIISDPLDFESGYRAKDSHWRWLLNELHKYGAEGWNWREYAGIHVNQDVRHVSEETVLKYAIFISNAAALSKFIAGRRKVYGRSVDDDEEFTMYGGGYKKKEAKNFRQLTIKQSLKEAFKDGKYSPVHLRDSGCMETRIFGSNIKYEGFMACVEYCVAVLEFVQTIDAADVFSPIVSSMFRSWLGGCAKKYPNLSARLGIVPHAANTATPSTVKVAPLRAVA